MLTYADVCIHIIGREGRERMLTYADMYMLTYADVYMLTYAEVCWRFLGREGRERKYASDEDAGAPLEGAARWECKSVGVFFFFTSPLLYCHSLNTVLIQG